MASAIAHFFVGAGIALPAMELGPLRGVLPRWAIPVTAALFAVAPDLDTYAMRAFDIPYGSFFAHRGFFHSPFFLALALAITVRAIRVRAITVRGRGARWLVLVWTCAAVTHPLLDMLTDGGSGVMLLFPFSSERLFFPWRPILVSPLSIVRFFDHAGEILWSELPFCAGAWIAGIAGLAAQRFAARGE